MLSIESGSPRFQSGFFPADVQRFAESLFFEVRSHIENGSLAMFSSDAVSRFEKAFGDYLGGVRCAAVSNGTAALWVALRASGLKKGDKVILPGYSYVATLNAVVANGCIPLFVDVDASSFCIDTACIPMAYLREAKAIVPVHLFGNPCDMTAVSDLATKHGLAIIEDCAQSCGARWDGRPVGTVGLGCYSFMQNKIVRMGEGGAVTGLDAEKEHAVKLFRQQGERWRRHGCSTTEKVSLRVEDVTNGIDYPDFGLNFRLPTISALIGLYSLQMIDEELAQRRRNALMLEEALGDLPEIRTQVSAEGASRVWSSFVGILEEGVFPRDVFLACCLAEGIPIGVHFPYPLYDLPIGGASRTKLPGVEMLCKSHFVLPVHSSLNSRHMEAIVETVRSVVVYLRNSNHQMWKRARQFLERSELAALMSGTYFEVHPCYGSSEE